MSLEAGEGALFFGRHPRGGGRQLGGALGLCALGALLLLSWPRAPSAVHLGALAAIGLALAWALWWVAHWRRRGIVLDAAALRIGAGLVGRRSRVVPLGEIEGATVEQRLLERLVGTGDVELLLTGGRSLTVRDVRRPGRLVNELAAACRRLGAPPAPPGELDRLLGRGIITEAERLELEQARQGPGGGPTG